MSHPTVARRERTALADLFDRVGPDQPTLDEGWLTADLLHHLIVRERRPDAAPGQFIGLFEPWTERLKRRYAELPWVERVDLFRSGPQWFNPLRLERVDSAFNTGEFFIHHEDVRRGVPGWTVRELDPETTHVLLDQVTSAVSRGQLTKLRVGVAAELPDRRRFQLVVGDPAITLVGAPGELVLWISGRRTACEVEVRGTRAALEIVESSLRR